MVRGITRKHARTLCATSNLLESHPIQGPYGSTICLGRKSKFPDLGKSSPVYSHSGAAWDSLARAPTVFVIIDPGLHKFCFFFPNEDRMSYMERRTVKSESNAIKSSSFLLGKPLLRYSSLSAWSSILGSLRFDFWFCGSHRPVNCLLSPSSTRSSVCYRRQPKTSRGSVSCRSYKNFKNFSKFVKPLQILCKFTAIFLDFR